MERTFAELLRVEKLGCAGRERENERDREREREKHSTESARTQRNLITKGPWHSMCSLFPLDNNMTTKLGKKFQKAACHPKCDLNST